MPARQPRISPPMLAKMKLEAVFAAPPGGTRKLPAPAPATPPVGLTIRASVAFAAPDALTIVDVLDPWLTGHHGEPALAARPHGLTSNGSWRSAGISVVFDDMMLRTTYWSLGAANAGAANARLATVTPSSPLFSTA